MGENSGPTTPFNKAPADILFNIFLACLSELKRSPPEGPRMHPIISISQVSRQWRDLSLNTSALWSVVDVNIIAGPMIPALEKKTGVVLLRSGACPLTVRLSTVSYDKSNRMPTSDFLLTLIGRIVRALLAKGRRWEELQVDCAGGWIESEGPFHFFSTLSPALVPNLEKIVLNLSERLTIQGNNPTPAIFRGRNLRILELRNFWFQFSADRVNWKALTELSIGDEDAGGPLHVWSQQLTFVDIPFVAKVLGQCSNLVHCSIALTDVRETPQTTYTAPEDHIFLPYLQSLALYGHTIPSGLASFFNLPRITSLSMFPREPTLGDDNDNVILEWGFKFGKQLAEFTFFFSALSRENILDLLPYLDNISCLRVVSRKPRPHLDFSGEYALFDQGILDELTPNFNSENPTEASAECWCPHLQTLHCVIPATFGTHREVKKARNELLSFVEARRQLGHGLTLLRELKLELDTDFFSEQSLESTLRRRGVNCDHFFVGTCASDLWDAS